MFIKNDKAHKETVSMGDSKGKKKSMETISEKDIMADILHKEFKTIVLKMLKELKENVMKSRK